MPKIWVVPVVVGYPVIPLLRPSAEVAKTVGSHAATPKRCTASRTAAVGAQCRACVGRMAGTRKAGTGKKSAGIGSQWAPMLCFVGQGGLTSCFLYISHTWWYLMGNRTKRWGLGMRRGSSSSAAERVGRVRAIAFALGNLGWPVRDSPRALCSDPGFFPGQNSNRRVSLGLDAKKGGKNSKKIRGNRQQSRKLHAAVGNNSVLFVCSFVLLGRHISSASSPAASAGNRPACLSCAQIKCQISPRLQPTINLAENPVFAHVCAVFEVRWHPWYPKMPATTKQAWRESPI